MCALCACVCCEKHLPSGSCGLLKDGRDAERAYARRHVTSAQSLGWPHCRAASSERRERGERTKIAAHPKHFAQRYPLRGMLERSARRQDTAPLAVGRHSVGTASVGGSAGAKLFFHRIQYGRHARCAVESEARGVRRICGRICMRARERADSASFRSENECEGESLGMDGCRSCELPTRE